MPTARYLAALAAAGTTLALASCAGTRGNPPHPLAQPDRTVPSDPSDRPDRPAQPAPPAAPDKPSGTPPTGQVEFRGFTPDALADFRIIPEEGDILFTPANGVHRNVDGFWWRPSRQWFKIPNHCVVVVTAAPEPDLPSAFTETHDCGSFGSALQKLRGLPDTPGFYPDAGATGHGTDYPFQP